IGHLGSDMAQPAAALSCCTAAGLFVPKPNRGVDCQGCGPSDLGTTVRQRSSASGDEHPDCYSWLLGSRARRSGVGSTPDPQSSDPLLAKTSRGSFSPAKVQRSAATRLARK